MTTTFGRYCLIEPLSLENLAHEGIDVEASDLVDWSITTTAGPAKDAIEAGAPLRLDRSGLATVSVLGLLNKRFSFGSMVSSYIATQWAIEAAVADPKVKTILMKFDSPGGYVDGIAEASDAIAAASKVKRVVAQVDGLTASAAYWLASQSNEIYAGRLDDVGSIGVLAVLYDFSKKLEDEGIKAEVFSTGKYKWTGVMGTSLTDDQRTYLQDDVDRIGDAFVADVARGRRRSSDDVGKWATGRVWGSEEALAMGLIDGIRSYPETVAALTGELSAQSKADADGRLRRARAARARAVQKF